ncbi:MAG: 50S ribosomal protein L4 [Deltaproteobacteria bacterium]|nr:50S ribosomal protein L4 [Deltaproteobacteria bacterium]
MAKVEVVDQQNKKAGSVDLAPAVFETAVRPHLYHAEVRRQLNGRRAGTHSTKNRAGVSGGGIKPYKQKGTGRARQGTIRAPQYAGGGVVFGPVPRGYDHKLPKKVRRAALASALTQRAQESALTVVDRLAIDGYSTKKMRDVLKSLGLEGRSTLVVIEQPNPTVEASARNLPGVTVIRSEGVNVYDVLRHQSLLITRPALDALQTRLDRSAKSASAAGGE